MASHRETSSPIWERRAGFLAICSALVESAFLHFSFLVYTLVIKFCFPLLSKPMVLIEQAPQYIKINEIHKSPAPNSRVGRRQIL